MKVVAAVGELETEYEGRVQFNIVSAEETAERGDEIDALGFTEQLHGLAGFTSEGDPVIEMPGHQFEKAEIAAAIEELLADS